MFETVSMQAGKGILLEALTIDCDVKTITYKALRSHSECKQTTKTC